MSKAKDEGSDDSIKEGLGKLASPVDEGTVPSGTGLPKRNGSSTGGSARKYWRFAIVGFATIFCVCFFAVAGVFMKNPDLRAILLNIAGHPTKILTGHGIDPSGYYNLADHFPPDKRKSLTVLLLGSDHDTVGKREPGHTAVPVDVPNTPGRSDAIMVARFEFDGDAVSSVNVLSIPRDTRVRVPGHGVHKINAAHAYGGPELSCATIRDVFGIDPDYYVDLNFEGFQQVVDAVGGVDVNVHEQLDYDDNWGKLHIHLKPGQQHLNGYRSMGYVRFRHTDNDLMRAQRQHEFLEALRARVTSPAAFLSLPNAVSAVTNNLHSNLTMDQMLTLANLARKAPKDAICLDTLPVIQGRTFVYIDRRKSLSVIRKMFFKTNQVAEVDIKTPDTETIRTHHRRRHTRDIGSDATARHHDGNIQPTAGTVPDNGVSPAPPASTGSSPSENETNVKPDKPEKPDKTAPSDSAQPGETSTPDSTKSPAKGKDGTGTSSGEMPAVLRG